MTLRISKLWLASGIFLSLILVAGGLWYFLDIHKVQRFSCDFVDSDGITSHENIDMPQIDHSAYLTPSGKLIVSRDRFVISTDANNIVSVDTTIVTISRHNGAATEEFDQDIGNGPSRGSPLHGSCATIRNLWVTD